MLTQGRRAEEQLFRSHDGRWETDLYSYLFQFLNPSHLGAEDTPLIVYILQPVNAKLITNLPIPPKDILKDF